MRLGVEERIERYHLLPFLVLAHSNQELHGFQESRGHWISVALGPSEKVSQLRGYGHVAAAITNASEHWDSPPIPAASTTSTGRRTNACSPSMAAKRPGHSHVIPYPGAGWKRDNHHLAYRLREFYIRSSSSSITSTQVVTGGNEVTGTPRFVAMSCTRP